MRLPWFLNTVTACAWMVDDLETTTTSLLAPSPDRLASTSVFPLIHQLRTDVQQRIDTALTWEQVRTPALSHFHNI